MKSVNKNQSKLLFRDIIFLGTAGLKARPNRVVLSALGIAIGIAAMISVVGISASSQAKLNQQLDSLGTNLLVSTPAKDLFTNETAELPVTSLAQLGRLPQVEAVSSTAALENVSVYRNRFIEKGYTLGINTQVANPKLLEVLGAKIHSGSWFNDATAAFPTVVLGWKAAQRLGVTEPGTQVWLGERNFTVIGILEPAALAENIDSSALISATTAAQFFGYLGNPTQLYVRANETQVSQVRKIMSPTIDPQTPTNVEVSRPSDALAAKNASDQAFTGLLVGLGSIALLVGGIGVANTMVISVLERRREIGLRRALGATKGHICSQFLAEALLLSGLGGVMGVAIGSAVTFGFAVFSGWPVVLPILVLVVGVIATLFIGAIAGFYPAVRAAQTPPTAALSS